MNNSTIIKRTGPIEIFDSKKLYMSIYTSCLAAHEKNKDAELNAEKVVDGVTSWLKSKNTTVSSNDIRRKASNLLNDISPDAAYCYLHHRVIW